MIPMLGAIFVLQWLILLTPGPNVLLVSLLAASGQRRAAFAAGFGITAVALLWALLALVGVQALFVALPSLRTGVQILGGLYLCRMGWRMWRAGGPGNGPAQAVGLGTWPAFRVGVITNLLNPKSALFYSSVFAAALPVHATVIEQSAVLALVGGNALIWHSALAGALSHPAAQAAYARQQRRLNRVAGVCFGLFGARLLVQGTREAWGSGAYR